ncbi:hypothetical protein FBQ97_06535, partial [Acidobacteria bacterium ACD]|nr:hypothetical protein [Acidobacteria bacterium ACD]
MIRIVVAEDQAMVLGALAALLSLEDDLEVVGTAPAGAAALELGAKVKAQLEAAIAFYTATFPNSEVRNVVRTGKDGPINSAEFVVGGQRFMGYNGGEYFSFSEGFSLYVDCADQAEVDEYWDKLVKAGATPTACGWIKDPFGLS